MSRVPAVASAAAVLAACGRLALHIERGGRGRRHRDERTAGAATATSAPASTATGSPVAREHASFRNLGETTHARRRRISSTSNKRSQQ